MKPHLLFLSIFQDDKLIREKSRPFCKSVEVGGQAPFNSLIRSESNCPFCDSASNGFLF